MNVLLVDVREEYTAFVPARDPNPPSPKKTSQEVKGARDRTADFIGAEGGHHMELGSGRVGSGSTKGLDKAFSGAALQAIGSGSDAPRDADTEEREVRKGKGGKTAEVKGGIVDVVGEVGGEDSITMKALCMSDETDFCRTNTPAKIVAGIRGSVRAATDAACSPSPYKSTASPRTDIKTPGIKAVGTAATGDDSEGNGTDTTTAQHQSGDLSKAVGGVAQSSTFERKPAHPLGGQDIDVGEVRPEQKKGRRRARNRGPWRGELVPVRRQRFLKQLLIRGDNVVMIWEAPSL